MQMVARDGPDDFPPSPTIQDIGTDNVCTCFDTIIRCGQNASTNPLYYLLMYTQNYIIPFSESTGINYAKMRIARL